MALIDNTVLLWTPQAGLKIREDGVLKYVRTGYDMSPESSAPLFPSNNLDGSATASQQPRLVGGIAPNSKVAASNQSGESRKFTHPSLTVTGTYTTVKMMDTTGKYEFTYTEVTSGTLSEVTWTGNLRLYIVYNGVLSAAQRTELETIMYNISPEIESVDIGTQTWATRNFEAVVTPEGNMIANVEENGAVEKVVNGGMEGTFTGGIADGWTLISGTGAEETTIVQSGTKSQKIILAGNTLTFRQNITGIVGKYYKISGYIRSSGTDIIRLRDFNGLSTDYVEQTLVADTWTYFELYVKKSNTTILPCFFSNDSITNDLYIDNVSVKELNWSNATEIYEAVYAATAGTAAEKEYAALKEAAMWCYYDNNPDNGAIYGKLYNWYAAKLLDLDMQSSGFGWRVPTSEQFNALATYLDGASVAGGKMKMTGTDYWNTPNTGATNESGFTALGGGSRKYNDGVFIQRLDRFRLFSSTEGTSTTAKSLYIFSNDELIGIENAYINDGRSIRLIKE